MADFNTEDMITYDELSKSLRDLIDSKALALNLANHVADSTSHITKEERDKWNSSASGSDMTNHINNDSIHVSVEDRESWSNKANKADLDNHVKDIVVHITSQERMAWNDKLDEANFNAFLVQLNAKLQILGMEKITYTTPGTYTWKVPDGITSVYVTMVGAGGGNGSDYTTPESSGDSGGVSQTYNGGDGGTGEFIYRRKSTVTPGSNVSIIVGAGGDNSTGSLNTNPAKAGGNSSFGTLVVRGGGPGVDGTNNNGADGTSYPNIEVVSWNTSKYGTPGSRYFSGDTIPIHISNPANPGFVMIEML